MRLPRSRAVAVCACAVAAAGVAAQALARDPGAQRLEVGGLYGSGRCKQQPSVACSGPVTVAVLTRARASVTLVNLRCEGSALLTLGARIDGRGAVSLGPTRRRVSYGDGTRTRLIAVSLRARRVRTGALRGTLRLTGVRPMCRAPVRRLHLRYAGQYVASLP